jgi:hypothetical protein
LVAGLWHSQRYLLQHHPFATVRTVTPLALLRAPPLASLLPGTKAAMADAAAAKFERMSGEQVGMSTWTMWRHGTYAADLFAPPNTN